MRIRGVKADKIAEDIGESVDVVDTSFAKLYEDVKKLTSVKSNDFQGVSILTDAGNFKSTYEILRDISRVWNEIGDASQAALLETLAGKTRGAVIAAILQNQRVLEDSYEDAGSVAAGATERAMDVALDSIQAKTNQLAQSWQTLWQNFLDTGMIKDAVDALNGLVKVLDKIINVGGNLPDWLGGGAMPLASTIAAGSSLINSITKKNGAEATRGFDIGSFVNSIISQVQSDSRSKKIGQALGEQVKSGLDEALDVGDGFLNNFLDGLKNLTEAERAQYLEGDNLAGLFEKVASSTDEASAAMSVFKDVANQSGSSVANLVTNMATAASGTTAMKTAFVGLGAAMKAALISVAWTAVITAIAAAIVYVIKQLVTWKQRTIEAGQAVTKALNETKKAHEDNVRSIENLRSEYDELSKGVDEHGNNISLTAEQYARYNEIIDQLTSKYPQLISSTKQDSDALESKNSIIEQAIDLEEQLYQAQLRRQLNEGKEDYFKGWSIEYKDSLKEAQKTEEEFEADLTDALASIFASAGMAPEDMGSFFVEALGIDDDSIHTVRDFVTKYTSEVASGSKDIIGALQQYANDHGKTLDQVFHSDAQALIAAGATYYDAVGQVGKEYTQKAIDDYIDPMLSSLEGYKDLADTQKSIMDALVDGIKATPDMDGDDFNKIVNDLYSTITSSKLTATLDKIQSLSRAESNPTNYFQNVEEQLKTLRTLLPDDAIQIIDEKGIDLGVMLNVYPLDANGKPIKSRDQLIDTISKFVVDDATLESMTQGELEKVLNIGLELSAQDPSLQATTDYLLSYADAVILANDLDEEAAEIVENVAESFDDYIAAIKEVNEYVVDNTKLTDEQYANILKTVDSEADLAGIIEEVTTKTGKHSGWMLKDAAALRSVANESSRGAKIQAQAIAQYARTSKQIASVVTQSIRLHGANSVLSDSAQSVVSVLGAQQQKLRQLISDYQDFQIQLSYTSDAFAKFSEAQERDAKHNYDDQLENIYNALNTALSNKEYGTEAFQVAFAELIDADLQAGEDVEQKTQEWLKIRAERGLIDFDENGAASISKENAQNWVKVLEQSLSDGTEGVLKFDSAWNDFYLNGTQTIDKIAQHASQVLGTNVSTEEMWGVLTQIDKLNKNGTRTVDQVIVGDPNSTTNKLKALSQEIDSLTAELLSFYDAKTGELISGADVDRVDELVSSIAELEKQYDETGRSAVTTLNLIMQKQTEAAEASEQLRTVKAEMESLDKSNPQEAARFNELVDQAKELTGQVTAAQTAIDEMLNGDPVEIVVNLGLEELDKQIEELEAKLASLDRAAPDYQINAEPIEKELAELKQQKFEFEVNFGVNNDSVMDQLEAAQEFKIDDKKFKIIATGLKAARDNFDAIVKDLAKIPSKVNINVQTTRTGSVVALPSNSRTNLTSRTTQNKRLERGFANGGVTDTSGRVLVGELGPELVSQNGHYFTVGEHGAELVNLGAGAIVFNHRQTQDLLRTGRTTRGKAFAQGNAFAIGSNTTSISTTGDMSIKAYTNGKFDPSKIKDDTEKALSEGASEGAEQATDEWFSKWEEAIRNLQDSFAKSVKTGSDYMLDTVSYTVGEIDDEYADSYLILKEGLEKLQKYNVDPTKSVFGNIDLNNRQVIKWTQELVDQNREALEDWKDEEMESVNDFVGSISTVIGGSHEFDGVEIAFSPMLQTDHGAELLGRGTLFNYIDSLIDKAGEGWTNEQLFALDREGLEVNGRIIKNVIADIGDTAKATGEVMHELGTDGSIQLNLKKVQEGAEKAGLSLEQYYKVVQKYIDNGYQASSLPVHQYDPTLRGQYYDKMIEQYQQYYAQYAAADAENSEKLKDAWESLYGEQKQIIEDAYQNGEMTTAQYLQNLPVLYKSFYNKVDGFAKQSAAAQKEYVRTVKSLYEQMFSAASTLIGHQISDLQDKMNDAVKAYQDEMKNLVKPIEIQIGSLDNQIYGYQQSIQGLEDRIYDIDQQIKALENNKKPFENQIKLNEKQIKYRQKLIDANEKEIKSNDKRVKLLEKEIDADDAKIKANDKIIKSLQKQIDANDDEIKSNEKVIKQHEKIIAANDKEIKSNDKIIAEKQKLIEKNDEEIAANNKVIKQFQKQIDANNKLIKANDKIVSSKQKLIDANDDIIHENEKIIKANDRLIRDNQDIIDTYNDQIEAHKDSEEPLQNQIELNEKIIENIEKANEARQRAIDLEKAQYDLARAENQRTQRVFTGDGFSYQADQNAIRDARNNLDSQLVEQRKADVQGRSDVIQSQIDSIDDQISSIEKLIESLERENKQIDKQSEVVRRANEELQDRSDLIQEQIDKIQKQSQAIQEQSDIIQESIDVYSERNEAISERSELIQEEIDKITKLNEAIQARSELEQEEIDRIKEQNEVISERSEVVQEEIDKYELVNETIREHSESIQEDIDKINAQSEAIREKSELIQDEIDKLNEHNDLLQEQIDLISENIDALNEQKEAQQTTIDHYNREIELLNREKEQLERNKSEIEDYYNDLIEATQDFYQAQVDALEKIQKQFARMQELDELAKSQELLKTFGITMEDVINNNDATMKRVRDNYADIVAATYQDNRDLLKIWGELLGVKGLDNMVVSADDVATGIDNMVTNGRSLNVVSGGFADTATATGNAKSQVDGFIGAWQTAQQVVPTAVSAITYSMWNLEGPIRSAKNELSLLIGQAELAQQKMDTLSSYGSSNYNSGYRGYHYATGTALVNGSWGLKSSGPSIVGELGPEIVVRGDKYFTVGDNGPELRKDLRRGDIIFNAAQSASIFKYGRAAGRGKAYAQGSAGDLSSGLIPSSAPDYVTKFMNAIKSIDLNISKIVPAFKAPNLSFATGTAPALAGAGGETFTINTVNVTMPNFNSTNSEGFVKDLKNKALQRFSRR